MGKTIFFSPVGGTDPMPRPPKETRDASMMHIFRLYSPDYTYLYLTSDMLANEEKDQRYTKALRKLAAQKGKSFEEGKDYSLITSSFDGDEVVDFDVFYDEFSKCIDRIFAEQQLTKKDDLIVNVSSGTPAMKSSLFVLKCMKDIPCKLIQVSTPTKKINDSHNSDFYDVDALFEENFDNLECEDRSKEISCNNLERIRLGNVIKHLVEEYNYSAAFELYKELSKSTENTQVETIKQLLLLGKNRFALKTDAAMKIAEKIGAEELFNVKDVEDNPDALFEYALLLKLKRTSRDFTGFIIGLSPLYTRLVAQIYKNLTDINIYDDSKYGKIIISKCKNEKLKSALQVMFPDKDDILVNVSFMKKLIIGEYPSDPNIKTTIEEAREIEEKLRNTAAHEIVSIDINRIQKAVNKSPDEILENVKSLFSCAGYNLSDSDWNAYEKLNALIYKQIDLLYGQEG